MPKADTPSPAAPDDEFDPLFNSVLTEHSLAHRTRAAHGPAHRALAAWAQAAHLEWASDLLGCSLLLKTRQPAEALAVLEKCGQAIPARRQGWWHHLKGTAYRDLRDFDRALQELRLALADPDFHGAGNVWNVWGLTCHRMGDWDAAIVAYGKALAVPHYATPGFVWHNLAMAYAGKGDFATAISGFRKALASPEVSRSPARAWHHLGLALADHGEFPAAIDAFHRALDSMFYEDSANTWAHLASAYHALGKMNAALEACRRALEAPEEEGAAHARAKELRAQIERTRSAGGDI